MQVASTARINNGDGSYHFEPTHFDVHCESLADELAERGLTQEEALSILDRKQDQSIDLSWFVAWALDDKNPLLKLWSAAFALGMEITEGVSESQKAKELGVSRAAINKRVKELRKRYGFRSRNMRKDSASDSCREDKKNNHWRYQQTIETAKNELKNPN